MCLSCGFSLLPFICGSHGGLSADASQFVKSLGSALSCVTDFSREAAISFLHSRISFAVQKAQATAILTLGEKGGVLM